MHKILDLGCGTSRVKNSIGVDININNKPDVIHDLNKFPYPFKNSTFTTIYCNNILFHLNDLFKVMEELHRILEDNGEVIVTSAYFRSPYAYHCPNTKNYFTVNTFNFFNPNHIFFKKFQYVKIKFDVKKITFNENFKNNFIKSLVKIMANRYPSFYERYFSHIIPLDSVHYYLKKIA